MSVEYWLGLGIGIMGSLHCIGMCGPIALMVSGSSGRFWSGTVLYHIGKIAAYASLGMVIGAIGQGIALAGVQGWLSLGIGISLLLIVLLAIPVESKIIQFPLVKKFYRAVSHRLAGAMKNKPGRTGFTIGYLNGFIPCGLVYLAVAGAIATGSWWEGGLFMILFGLGTVPALLVAAFLPRFLKPSWRKRFNQLMPIFMIIVALIFIYRGLRIEFPLELKFWELKDNPEMCH